jgi:hypothetical protein
MAMQPSPSSWQRWTIFSRGVWHPWNTGVDVKAGLYQVVNRPFVM